MTYPLVYHPSVQCEIDEAFDWYERRKPGLGVEFLAELKSVFNRLATSPAMYREIWDDVRRAPARRFPFGVFYRLHDDRVEVIAVQHGSRDPSRWQSRS